MKDFQCGDCVHFSLDNYVTDMPGLVYNTGSCAANFGVFFEDDITCSCFYLKVKPLAGICTIIQKDLDIVKTVC